jgi:hypothetical protein
VKPRTLLLVTAVLVFAAAQLQAQPQWKWRDAQGKLQYSDRPPPPGTPDKDILLRPPVQRPTIIVGPPGAAASSPAPVPASGPSKAERDAAALQKQEQEQLAARQKDDERRAASQRRDNCDRAQAQLRELQSGTRLVRSNERGERVFLNEAQIAAEAGRARALIDSECR